MAELKAQDEKEKGTKLNLEKRVPDDKMEQGAKKSKNGDIMKKFKVTMDDYIDTKELIDVSKKPETNDSNINFLTIIAKAQTKNQ